MTVIELLFDTCVNVWRKIISERFTPIPSIEPYERIIYHAPHALYLGNTSNTKGFKGPENPESPTNEQRIKFSTLYTRKYLLDVSLIENCVVT